MRQPRKPRSIRLSHAPPLRGGSDPNRSHRPRQVGRSELALSALQEMRGRGLRPDVRIHESVLLGLSYQGDPDLCLRALEDLKSRGLSPSTNCYFACIRACVPGSRYVLALRLLGEMRDRGVQVTDLVLREVIRCFWRGSAPGDSVGTTKTFREIRRLMMDSQHVPHASVEPIARATRPPAAVPAEAGVQGEEAEGEEAAAEAPEAAAAAPQLLDGPGRVSLVCMNAVLEILGQWGWSIDAVYMLQKSGGCPPKPWLSAAGSAHPLAPPAESMGVQPNLSSYIHVADAFLTRAGKASVDKERWTAEAAESAAPSVAAGISGVDPALVEAAEGSDVPLEHQMGGESGSGARREDLIDLLQQAEQVMEMARVRWRRGAQPA